MCKFKNITINHKVILAYLSFFTGVGLAIAGIAIYPPGVIHGSVLIMVAQLLVLCATLLGLNVKFDLQNKYFHSHHNESSPKQDLE
jgi:hypothetical protein